MRNFRLSEVFAYFVWTRAMCICDSFAMSSASPSPSSTASSLADRIDAEHLVETIRSARVYQHENFLSEEEIDFLFDDINNLRQLGSFARSGLSDTSRGQRQDFGTHDRSISVVPWFADALTNKHAKENVVAPRLNELRHLLADVLDRPSMRENDLAHECYYSISGPGSFLNRHMDDKHEDLKGSKGWLLPSRRSLSWLLYLSDADWTLENNGGALRSFPPKQIVQPTESTHEGNLQIGWLHRASSNSGSMPVYMDSWFRNANAPDPHAILYTVAPQSSERQILTKPWLNDNLPTNLLPVDFIKQMAAHDAQATAPANPLLFVRSEYARDFFLIEDRQVWDQGHAPVASRVEDIPPLRGSLIIFDSILVPHQVQVVKEGERVALAGWWHERTQVR